MDTTGEITDVTAKAFIELLKDFSIVRLLHESNCNILKDLAINENWVYISSWISQLAFF